MSSEKLSAQQSAERHGGSRPLHRQGLFDDARLEEIYRRRVERLAQGPPSRISRGIQALTYALMFGVGTYMVLYQDYGKRQHCFTGLRKWYFGKVNRLWTLSGEEEKELRERGQIRAVGDLRHMDVTLGFGAVGTGSYAHPNTGRLAPPTRVHTSSEDEVEVSLDIPGTIGRAWVAAVNRVGSLSLAWQDEATAATDERPGGMDTALASTI
ncbi:hypothetical protein LPJ61_002730 [Coemansia biformis]|uniref:Uncharacterized protein n=1 Tax=Coemansia biformis TaxID=1286918 RepID=A0A9W7YCJ0_9FUNG|nr:hypothetical protein LPJ61_002730 [Coemansia biformis]